MLSSSIIFIFSLHLALFDVLQVGQSSTSQMFLSIETHHISDNEVLFRNSLEGSQNIRYTVFFQYLQNTGGAEGPVFTLLTVQSGPD